MDDLLDVLLDPLAFDADAGLEAALEELLDEAFDALDLEAEEEEASLGASLTSEGSMCAGGGSERAVLAIEGIGSAGRGTVWEMLVGGGVDRGVPADMATLLAALFIEKPPRTASVGEDGVRAASAAAPVAAVFLPGVADPVLLPVCPRPLG